MSTYPEAAACARSSDKTLWDSVVHGENLYQREARHAQAKAICHGCPVALECAVAVDWAIDEGIRAGHLLPEKKTAYRSVRDREIPHGTEAGYAQHRRRGNVPPLSDPCGCRGAARRAAADRDARRVS